MKRGEKMPKLTAVKPAEIPAVAHKKSSEYRKLLETFIKSDNQAVEVIPEKNEKVASIRASLNRIITDDELKVSVVSRAGKVYMQKVK